MLPRLFGGEETSARSAPIEQRAEAPSIGLSSADAARLGFEPGMLLTLATATARLTLQLRCDQCLPSGIVSVPEGISNDVNSGDWVRLEVSDPDYKEARA